VTDKENEMGNPLKQHAAYEIVPPQNDNYEQPTLRDRFAMAALPSAYANNHTTHGFQDVANEAYAIADAMLRARGGS